MKFLANENVPSLACQQLKRDGVNIVSVLEVTAGAKDEDVISLALRENRAIITFDKDFGELVFAKKVKVPGIILLRFPPESASFVASKIRELLANKDISLENHFVVVEEDRIRTRLIK